MFSSTGVSVTEPEELQKRSYKSRTRVQEAALWSSPPTRILTMTATSFTSASESTYHEVGDEVKYHSTIWTCNSTVRFHDHVINDPTDNLDCNSAIECDTEPLKVDSCHTLARRFSWLSIAMVRGKHSSPSSLVLASWPLVDSSNCLIYVFSLQRQLHEHPNSDNTQMRV